MQKKIAESEMSEDIVESLRKYQCPENKGCNPFVDYCQCALMDSGADEIERLQEEHHDVRILNEQYYNENEILIDEIERLREALNQAQCGCELPCLQGEFCSSWICRSALQQKDNE